MKLLQVISTKSNITLVQEYVISDIFEPLDLKKYVGSFMHFVFLNFCFAYMCSYLAQ